jgi:hypothetical protein
MQIGNAEMDRVYSTCIATAIEDAGLTPRRVDKHNRGGLLQNEIATFIERALVVVADLTNERPNCYAEVGYVLGLGRASGLVLAARTDHRPDRPDRKAGDPKVHFDLSSYDILYWDPDDLSSYRDELAKRIRRRLVLSGRAGSGPGGPTWDDDWIKDARANAETGYAEWR